MIFPELDAPDCKKALTNNKAMKPEQFFHRGQGRIHAVTVNSEV